MKNLTRAEVEHLWQALHDYELIVLSDPAIITQGQADQLYTAMEILDYGDIT